MLPNFSLAFFVHQDKHKCTKIAFEKAFFYDSNLCWFDVRAKHDFAIFLFHLKGFFLPWQNLKWRKVPSTL